MPRLGGCARAVEALLCHRVGVAAAAAATGISQLVKVPITLPVAQTKVPGACLALQHNGTDNKFGVLSSYWHTPVACLHRQVQPLLRMPSQAVW